MHKIAKITLTLAAFGLAGTAAFAQTQMSFSDIDTDANGELSLTELQTAWPDFAEAEFTGADLDGSGGLSAEEISALQAAAQAAPAP
jgi:hypothetical protein